MARRKKSSPTSWQLSDARDEWLRGLKGVIGAPGFGGEFTKEEHAVSAVLQDLQVVPTSEELATHRNSWGGATDRVHLAAYRLRDIELQTQEPADLGWFELLP